MCLKNRYYPLVRTPSGKQKILFQYGLTVDNREAFDKLQEMRNGVISFMEGSPGEEDFETGEIRQFDFVKMVSVPCGMCRECLTDNSRQWAFRILKEAEDHDDNWFITFTYDDDQ